MRILSIMTLDHTPQGPPSEQDFLKMDAFIKELRASGALVDTGGVIGDMLEMKVSRKAGKTTITDGPFTEAKEVVGGYALLEVQDRDEAIALTNRFLDLIGDATCHIHEVSVA